MHTLSLPRETTGCYATMIHPPLLSALLASFSRRLGQRESSACTQCVNRTTISPDYDDSLLDTKVELDRKHSRELTSRCIPCLCAAKLMQLHLLQDIASKIFSYPEIEHMCKNRAAASIANVVLGLLEK